MNPYELDNYDNIETPCSPAWWRTSRHPRVYAREEGVVDWSTVACGEEGMELRYGHRQSWDMKDLVEWGREGRPVGAKHHDNFVRRVGPPGPIHPPKNKQQTGKRCTVRKLQNTSVGRVRFRMRRYSDKMRAGWE